MTLSKGFDYLVRVAGAGALVLGVVIWSGEHYALLHLHIALGVLVAAGLALVSLVALVRGVSSRIAILSLVWSGATIGFGLFQTDILVGDFMSLCNLATFSSASGPSPSWRF